MGANPLFSGDLLLDIGIMGVVCAMAPLSGAWKVCSYDNPKIQGLGKWAVAEHVKEANDGLQFVEVSGCEEEEQVGRGSKYHIFLHTCDKASEKGGFEAGVYEDASSKVRKLVSFDAIV
ncbi:hypothetical protein ACQ4PT_008243 [Festuca glaucescens]